jgi:hypothetical protein
MRTELEIIKEIEALQHERIHLKAVTKDGVPIEVGMKLYFWDGLGVTAFVVPEDTHFTEYGLRTGNPDWISEDYTELYVSSELAKEKALEKAKEEVERSKDRLKSSKKYLKEVVANIIKDLEKAEDV